MTMVLYKFYHDTLQHHRTMRSPILLQWLYDCTKGHRCCCITPLENGGHWWLLQLLDDTIEDTGSATITLWHIVGHNRGHFFCHNYTMAQQRTLVLLQLYRDKMEHTGTATIHNGAHWCWYDYTMTQWRTPELLQLHHDTMEDTGAVTITSWYTGGHWYCYNYIMTQWSTLVLVWLHHERM